MKNIFIRLLFIASLFPSAAIANDSVVQIATIDALLAGLYDGVTSIGSLKQYGDFGIGTFDALDGEMVVLDGTVYRVSADGRAAVVLDSETTPFATLTTFVADQQVEVPPQTDLRGFRSLVDVALPSANLFYAFRLEGHFKTMMTRSVPRQNKPYKPLVEVVKDQLVFNFEDVKGVLVGFYCPTFVKGINVPGYHLHFLTADRKGGGHVLDFSVYKAALKIDKLSRFVLQLPQTEGFAKADLHLNRQDELKKVEE